MITYVVIDVECDGRIPGTNSMLGFGAVATNIIGENLGEFEINMFPLEDCISDKNTMKWFNNSAKEAFEYLNKNQVTPEEALNKFGNWLLSLPAPRVMAAHPAPFDYMWIHWYFKKYLNDKLDNHLDLSPYFDSKCGPALDILSYASAILKKEYLNVGRENYDKEIHNNTKHTHLAIDDAREYSKLLVSLLNRNIKYDKNR